VYARRVDPLALAFRLSSHRPSYIGLLMSYASSTHTHTGGASTDAIKLESHASSLPYAFCLMPSASNTHTQAELRRVLSSSSHMPTSPICRQLPALAAAGSTSLLPLACLMPYASSCCCSLGKHLERTRCREGARRSTGKYADVC
jgi:hypothetical protein